MTCSVTTFTPEQIHDINCDKKGKEDSYSFQTILITTQ